MKTNLIAALALTAIVSASAFAGDNVTPLTRAQVQSELARARAAGEVDFAGSSYPTLVADNTHSNLPGKTRAQVQAELAKARANGELDFAGSEYPTLMASNTVGASSHGKTRAEVKAELAHARADGELNFAGSEYPLEASSGN